MKLLIYGASPHRTSRLVALLLSCALAACATNDTASDEMAMQTPPAGQQPRLITLYVPMPVPAPNDDISPLDYYAWAQGAPADELYEEQVRLSSPGPDSDPLVDKVHLGILMSVSAIASRESEREAKALLQSIDPANVTTSSRDYAAFADFLLYHLQQREELRAANSDAITSREKLEALQRNNAQLQQKIDALTRIEEQLIEREQAQGD